MANPVDPNSAVGQVQAAYGSFSAFFAAVSQFLAEGGSCPEFSDSVGSLDYSELQRVAKMGQSGSANYPEAAAVENVHQIVAVVREYGLRSKGKAQYYQDGQSDADNESNFYDTMMTFYMNMLQGVYSEGATS